FEFSSTTFLALNYTLMQAGATHGTLKNELCDVDLQGKIWQVNSQVNNFMYRLDLSFWPQQGPLPAGQAELNINEVRARLHNNGDMFWDGIGTAKYEVPKSGCGQSSL